MHMRVAVRPRRPLPCRTPPHTRTSDVTQRKCSALRVQEGRGQEKRIRKWNPRVPFSGAEVTGTRTAERAEPRRLRAL